MIVLKGIKDDMAQKARHSKSSTAKIVIGKPNKGINLLGSRCVCLVLGPKIASTELNHDPYLVLNILPMLLLPLHLTAFVLIISIIVLIN
ncbi:MAG: hypothetical protein ACJAXH_002462 [Colwellia sp.]